MEKRKKYIAYGSNLDVEQMAKRCPTAKVIGQGEVKDYELLFRGAVHGAVATIEPKEGGSVPVLIWDIGPKDEFHLDCYEGYPSFYDKRHIEVNTENGSESIMVYIMNDGRQFGVPSQNYLNTITRGYQEAGFDSNILQNAVEKAYGIVNGTVSMEESRKHMEEMEDNEWQIQQPLQ